MNDLLMCIDGIDGCGKSSQVAAVTAALVAAGIEARAATVPAFGARTVNTLAEKLTGDRHAYHPLVPAPLREWVFACDVAYYTKVHFRPALDAGVTLVWDRGPLSYRISAMVYDGLDYWVEQAHALYPQPRFTYLLDLEVELAASRLRARTNKPRQSDEQDGYLQAVRSGMLEHAAQRPDIILLDANREPADLTAEIVSHWLGNTR